MDMTEKQLSSEYKFRGRIMTARVDEVSLRTAKPRRARSVSMLAVSACCRSTRTATLFLCGSSAMRSILSCSKCPPQDGSRSGGRRGMRHPRAEGGDRLYCRTHRAARRDLSVSRLSDRGDLSVAALDLTEGEMQPDETNLSRSCDCRSQR